MPQDEKLSNKDYIAGKGSYWKKFSGLIRDADSDGDNWGATVRTARIDAAGKTARDKFVENNAMYRDQKDTRKGTTLGLIKTLGNMAKNEESGRAAARRMGMKGPAVDEYASKWERNTRGSTGFEKPPKPLTTAQQVKMISAMNPKSNGTFKGGTPRSSMSKNLKIK